MNSDSQIEKINTFKVMVEIEDDNTALTFLQIANWDEGVNLKLLKHY